jgi:hypothetical protein
LFEKILKAHLSVMNLGLDLGSPLLASITSAYELYTSFLSATTLFSKILEGDLDFLNSFI